MPSAIGTPSMNTHFSGCISCKWPSLTLQCSFWSSNPHIIKRMHRTNISRDERRLGSSWIAFISFPTVFPSPIASEIRTDLTPLLGFWRVAGTPRIVFELLKWRKRGNGEAMVGKENFIQMLIFSGNKSSLATNRPRCQILPSSSRLPKQQSRWAPRPTSSRWCKINCPSPWHFQLW